MSEVGRVGYTRPAGGAKLHDGAFHKQVAADQTIYVLVRQGLEQTDL